MAVDLSNAALNSALEIVARGFVGYVVDHGAPVRNEGDEPIVAFFRKAHAEDLGLEDALVTLIRERGGQVQVGAAPLHFGQFNFVGYERLLDHAPGELGREIEETRTALASVRDDAGGASLLRWVVQTKEDQLKRARSLQAKRNAPAEAAPETPAESGPETGSA